MCIAGSDPKTSPARLLLCWFVDFNPINQFSSQEPVKPKSSILYTSSSATFCHHYRHNALSIYSIPVPPNPAIPALHCHPHHAHPNTFASFPCHPIHPHLSPAPHHHPMTILHLPALCSHARRSYLGLCQPRPIRPRPCAPHFIPRARTPLTSPSPTPHLPASNNHSHYTPFSLLLCSLFSCLSPLPSPPPNYPLTPHLLHLLPLRTKSLIFTPTPHRPPQPPPPSTMQILYQMIWIAFS